MNAQLITLAVVKTAIYGPAWPPPSQFSPIWKVENDTRLMTVTPFELIESQFGDARAHSPGFSPTRLQIQEMLLQQTSACP